MLVGLSAQSRHAVTALSEALGIGPTTVLLCVWALVLGRRTATDQLLIGVTVPVVPGTAAAPVAGPATHVVPVHCRLDDHASVADVLRRTAAALDIALAARDVPMEDLIAELGVADDPQRLPLVQVTLDAYELLPPPGEAPAPGIRTDYGGGSPFDLTLGVRWEGGPQLALEYALAAVAPEEAADLADSLDTALTELAREPAAPLSSVRTISSAQQRRFQVLRERPAAAPPGDLWSLVVSRAEADPARIAVRDADARRSLSYRQLVVAAEQQSAELAAAGVGQDDHVVLAMPRSAAEIVAVLAVLRLGAAYVPNDLSSPDQRLRTILQPVAPRAVLGPPAEADRIRRLAPEGCAVPVVVDPWAAGTRLDLPPPAVHQPERVAYVAFTSGSTGAPKGVRVPHRAVSRLVRDVDYVRCGRGERFLRFAPLAFDASTLEIFAPLVNGGTIEVFPDALPSPTDLARFLTERRVSVLWLTAGLFRILVDLAPQAFSTVRQVLTGGDVVPSEQVRRLLESYPGLRVTNGYGPTENTTFTTVHHVDDPYDVDDPLPIGTPVPGTDVLVLDHLGRLLPPGAIGELYTGGQGLALDYLAAPEETAAAMGRTAPDTGERLYRTGDVVRWDARDRLLFLGRRDHQVKIRGFRVELEEIRRRLAEHPAVHDAVVVVVGADVDSRQLLAAVVSDHGPDLLPLLREYAGETLPRYAVPTLWAAVSRIPVTPNGKVDRRALEEAAVRLQEVAVGPRARDRPPVSPRRSPPSNALRSSPSAPSALG
jgi:amino acid adenylation domain-containing protein